MGLIRGDVEEGGEALSLVPQLEVPGSGHPLHALYLSDPLRQRLIDRGLSDEDIDTLLTPPPVKPRPQDDSYPLSCYYISTSHNTYLLSRQLLGTSSPTAYTHVITKGCRCVEIDAWDAFEGDEPIVTHGLTLTESTPFRDVCAAIGAAVQDDHWPLMISLECHANAKTQLKMVEIMKETWGNRLVDQSIENYDSSVPPSALMGRILLIVEYYPPEGEQDSGESFTSETDSASDNDDTGGLRGFMERLKLKKKDKKEKPKIIPELSELGVYAQSVKPKKDWLSKPEPETPLHLFINISEAAMGSIIPARAQQFILRGSRRQVRIYPKGTRIESNNYDPVPYWRAGSQICAQNWQRFDKGMQLTRAMFEGTDGWLLKPPSLLGPNRRGHEVPPSAGMQTFRCEILGVSAVPLRVPLPTDEEAKIYVLVQLFHADGDRKWRSPSLDAQLSAARDKVDLVFEEPQRFEWDFNSNRDLTFLRILIVNDKKLELDVKLGVHCINLADHRPGLQVLRLQDPNGNFTNASVLLRTELERAQC